MSEHATSVEAVSAPVDSSVAPPDNATAEGVSSSADATAGDSNGVSAPGTKEELPVTEVAKGMFCHDSYSPVYRDAILTSIPQRTAKPRFSPMTKSQQRPLQRTGQTMSPTQSQKPLRLQRLRTSPSRVASHLASRSTRAESSIRRNPRQR